MTAQPRTAVLIAGPTASGKSALALALAKAVGGTIINTDSMQVYADLQLLTARPTAQDMATHPHALYGHVDGADAYSAGRFIADVRQLIASTGGNTGARLPLIFVGGTGLYFKALLEGLAPVPPIPDEIRTYWRARADAVSNADLHAELARRDAVMAARLAVGDTQRIARALEVVEATGRSLANWQEMPGEPALVGWATARYVLTGERAELYRRADVRFGQMVACGALDEVRRLMARSLTSDLPLMRALGVQPLIAHLREELTLDEAIAAGQQDTRRYIKRQSTWLSRKMCDWNNVHIGEYCVSGGDFISDVRSRLDLARVGA